jgi:pilus assembly protein Flp/PilA
VRKLLTNTCGATAAEYALILAIIGAALALSALVLGGAISGAMAKAENDIQTCGGGC